MKFSELFEAVPKCLVSEAMQLPTRMPDRAAYMIPVGLLSPYGAKLTAYNIYQKMLNRELLPGEKESPKVTPVGNRGPTEEELTRLNQARLVLTRKDPILGSIISLMPSVYVNENSKFQTMAVSSNGNIYINIGFANALSFDELVGVLAHEAMHMMLHHLNRLQGRDQLISNIATDSVVNRLLQIEKFVLPPGGIQVTHNGNCAYGLLIVEPYKYRYGSIPQLDKRVYLATLDVDLSEAWEDVYANIIESFKAPTQISGCVGDVFSRSDYTVGYYRNGNSGGIDISEMIVVGTPDTYPELRSDGVDAVYAVPLTVETAKRFGVVLSQNQLERLHRYNFNNLTDSSLITLFTPKKVDANKYTPFIAVQRCKPHLPPTVGMKVTVAGRSGVVVRVGTTIFGRATIKWDAPITEALNLPAKNNTSEIGIFAIDVAGNITADTDESDPNTEPKNASEPGEGDSEPGNDNDLESDNAPGDSQSGSSSPEEEDSTEGDGGDEDGEIERGGNWPTGIDVHITEDEPEEDIVIAPGQSNTPLNTTPISQDDIETILRDAENASGRGKQSIFSSAGSPADKYKNLKPSTTDWRNLFRSFVKSVENVKIGPSPTKLRRISYGALAPIPADVKVDPDLYVCIAIDTSGSITTPIIRQFLSETLRLLKTCPKVKVIILLWNTRVYQAVPVKSAKDLDSLQVQSGGTTMGSVNDWLNDRKNQVLAKKVKGVIYFTDLEVESSPPLPKIPRMFCILQKHFMKLSEVNKQKFSALGKLVPIRLNT